MLSKEDVLEKANGYDFEAVREYIEQGGNTEIYDGSGNSLLSALLAGYYWKIFANDSDELKFHEEHEDDEESDTHVCRYCRMPLEDRPQPIKEQVDYLVGKGISVNAVGWKEAEKYQEYAPAVQTPLFHSVVYCDYCMTKYLLELGADPGQKLFSDGDYDLDGYEDWLLDHMDYYIMDGHRGDAMELDIEIAALLMHYGLDQWDGGYCIDVDKENRTIQGHGPVMMF